MRHIYPLLFLFLPCTLPGQDLAPASEIPARLLTGYWEASWITHPTESTQDWGVFHFRRTFSLAARPAKFIVHVSGDNRYRLFVNGTPVCEGPSRDELDHWRFETVDIGPLLKYGDNIVAAVVWNFGEHRPVFQASFATAFLLQAADQANRFVNTGEEGWRVLADEAYAPEVAGIRALHAYHVTGPGERVDAARYPWGWEQTGFDDSRWATPRSLEQAHPARAGTVYTWGLTPRNLPAMEEATIRLAAVRRAEGVTVPEDFTVGKAALFIPANTKAVVLFDQDHLTNAYPILSVSGGKGGRVTMTYAESLYLPGDQGKGDRNAVAGKEMRGQQDVFLPDGGAGRLFRPLWFRTYRYLQLEVETGADPLIIHELYGRFTGYPFQESARFSSSDPLLARIWEVGWRTARLCAGETYYDCPSYEQLQYVGDTRIQALISLYVAGDDRLMRQAIDAYDHSRFANGLTHSRYPEGRPVQLIPPYSLFWVSMVHDYWMHRDDPAYVRDKLMGVQTVLHWFEQQIDPATGLLGDIPYWNFVDWCWPWDPQRQIGGVPPLAGGSSILSLHLAYTLDIAAELFRALEQGPLADHYAQLGARIRQRVWETCWDERRGLLADTPARQSFSQHANIFGVLTGAIPDVARRAVMTKVLTDASLTQATFYFQFYLFEAMARTGLADQYIDRLAPWRDMLTLGLTTFAEEPEPARSDCHAWSASPNYHLLALVAGIRPAAPGFRSVRIEPNLGPLNWVEGEMPHPKGAIKVRFQREGKQGLSGEVALPPGVTGTLVWQGKTKALQAGRNAVMW